MQKKRSDLRIDRLHDEQSLGELSSVFDEVHIDGFALEESVLVHRPSSTLIVADLVHNIGQPGDGWTKTYSRLMGFHDRVAISRMIRWTAFGDSAAARQSVDRLARLSFDRLVVGHGTPLETGAQEAVIGAYEWLRPHRALVPVRPRTPGRGYCG